MTSIQAVRGMRDILPHEAPSWRSLETLLMQTVVAYGYQEIRLPVLEKTELFKRCLGSTSDVVTKEMYTFLDRNSENLTLRPEGTAPCVRACIEHNLLYGQTQKLWYLGPMFRHERPQKGRYRQFYQFGIEAFGFSEAYIEAEIIALSARIWQKLQIEHLLELQINSLGSQETRAAYRAALTDYFRIHETSLDEDSKKRLELNPLRILDSKNPALKELIDQAPSLLNYLDGESRIHFERLQQLLKALNISFIINPKLVRGLDYYNHTAFEWIIKDAASAQNTICAGGRYDGLVQQLGGPKVPAVGFAIGIERLLEFCSAVTSQQLPMIYLISSGDSTQREIFLLAERLRTEFPSLILIVDYEGGSFKAQFKRANKSLAELALIIGENELRSGQIGLKYLRESIDQQYFSYESLLEHLRNWFSDRF